MSCHYHVYVGPYLEVHNPVQDTTTKRQSCPNAKCNNHKKLVEANFCPKCGEKIKHLDVPSRGRKEFEVYNEFKSPKIDELRSEDLRDENYMYFRPDLGRGTCGRTYYDDCGIFPLAENTPATEMQAFAEKCTEEILRIEQVFGKDKVTIKWGAVAYWS
jgi:hypothetical protein